MKITFGVYRVESVQIKTGGYSAAAIGTPESEHATFDDAFEAAQAAGGNRWVISNVGSSEYVE